MNRNKKMKASKTQGRKYTGVVDKAQRLIRAGWKDFSKIADKSGAAESTVRTQFYRMGMAQ